MFGTAPAAHAVRALFHAGALRTEPFATALQLPAKPDAAHFPAYLRKIPPHVPLAVGKIPPSARPRIGRPRRAQPLFRSSSLISRSSARSAGSAAGSAGA